MGKKIKTHTITVSHKGKPFRIGLFMDTFQPSI
nr:MAG TPA: hypothetical protein [Caudoviricetes sp.]